MIAISSWATGAERRRLGLLMFSIFMSIVYLGNHFALLLLYDQEATVRVVYFLIDTVLESSVYLADISLLGFIYTIIAACLDDVGVKASIKTALKVSSFVVISILVAFWAAILALQIKFEVNIVTDPSKADPDEILVWTRLKIAYYATFVFALMKVLASAMWIIVGQRKRKGPAWSGIFLASLVAIPLLVRSATYLGFCVASLTRNIEVEAQTALNVITNIFFVLAYISVVLIAVRFKNERDRWRLAGQFGPPQTSPGTWYGAPNPPVFGNGGATYGNPSYNPRKEDEPIQCVTIYGGDSSYEPIYLPSSHPIFQNAPLPISLRIGYPLVIQRLVENTPRGQATDNQHATWLMIDPVSGFAPMAWQGGIGSVYVARPDRNPLTPAVLAAITDYVSLILDSFGELDPGQIAQKYYDKAGFERYLAQHS
ncbi:hypothetical protein MMC07_003665 [Pseudocyphellaria aurata]|nr:hypothetical protein [Pseudocyphellaria aurata]